MFIDVNSGDSPGLAPFFMLKWHHAMFYCPSLSRRVTTCELWSSPYRRIADTTSFCVILNNSWNIRYLLLLFKLRRDGLMVSLKGLSHRSIKHDLGWRCETTVEGGSLNPDARSLFFFLICFNWRIIALQYCDGFCHTSTWNGHRHTCVPSILNPSPLLPTPSLQIVPEHWLWVPYIIHQTPTGYLFYIW